MASMIVFAAAGAPIFDYYGKAERVNADYSSLKQEAAKTHLLEDGGAIPSDDGASEMAKNWLYLQIEGRFADDFLLYADTNYLSLSLEEHNERFFSLEEGSECFSLGEEGAADQLYSYAYDLGLIAPEQRADDTLLTRAEAVKILLDSAGYGEVAALEGIFRCAFADEQEIPAAYYGYAALAQGLGVVGGDGAGRFAAGRTATRQEAAVMLYNYMNR